MGSVCGGCVGGVGGMLRGYTRMGQWRGVACVAGGGGGRSLVAKAVLNGREGVWDPQIGVLQMAQSDFPDCKCRFFPRW